MRVLLSAAEQNQLHESVRITGSKSETNRLLLLQALYPEIQIDNISNSDDAQVMQKGLRTAQGTVDIHHAGTAMRFLTAYFASQQGKEVTLTGSQRMTERPIRVLVSALQALGANISYQKKEGYPPLQIKGKALTGKQVQLPADISSQYISALLLVAPSLPQGLELQLDGKITSVPYIKMTLALLQGIGVQSSFEGNRIRVFPKNKVDATTLVVESDWSSASYFYSIAALCDVGTTINLSAYKKESLQGDSVLADIYTIFGVETDFLDNTIRLTKQKGCDHKMVKLDLANAPDIAQTIAVTCFGLGVGCHLTGLHTLKIKETDRLEALNTELTKLGAAIAVTNKELTLDPSDNKNKNVAIDTYNDHRMAMAFAPLAFKVPLIVNNAEVVSKSYPDFWEDMRQLGMEVSSLE